MSIRQIVPLVLGFALACGESPIAPVLDSGNDRGRTDIPSFADAGSDAAEDASLDAVRDADSQSDLPSDAGVADTSLDAPADIDAPDGSIGPRGGRIDFDGGWLIVPPGAVTDIAAIVVTPEFDDIPPGFDIEGRVWRFEPNGLEFERPIEVCLTVDGIRPANMTLHWSRRGALGVFDSLASSPVDGAVCGAANHFSFGFLGRLTDPACDGLDCQPTVADCPTSSSVIPSVLGICIGGTCAYPIPSEVPCEPETTCQEGACVAPPRCGDGDVNGDEDCDGADFGGTDCRTLGFSTGDLSCTDACTINASECTGDPCEGVICEDPPEPACIGTRATTFGAGECIAGECAYEEVSDDCAASGQACAGGVCVRGPETGDLVVTEIMANPAGDDEGLEWFEIYNSSDRALALAGLALSDDGVDAIVLDSDFVLPAGEYAVLGASAEAAPGIDVVWTDSGSYALSNSSDEIEIHFAGTPVDRVAWGAGSDPPWERPNGATMSLDPDATSAAMNDSAAAWCAGTLDYGVPPNLGSPGAANGPCPGEAACGDGRVDDGEECDDGNLLDGDGCQSDCTLPECTGDPECDTPPSPSCDGDLASTYLEASCVDGLCVYTPTVTDCGGLELGCLDGACVDAPATYGELVITEFMANVDGDDTGFEWFEIHNQTEAAISLEGFTIRDDGTNSFDIGPGFSVAAGAYFVIGETAAAVPGGVDLAWDDIDPTFAIANTDDEIVIEWRGALLDRIAFTGVWPVEPSESLALSAASLDADANDSVDNWCLGVGDYGVAPNVGTPGEPNANCGAAGSCGDGVLDAGEECDDGNLDEGDGCDGTCGLEPEICAVSDDCDTPPANYCDSGTSAIRFAALGDCVDGVCSYTEMPVSCAGVTVCVDGECVEGTTIARGELVITEFLANPEGSDTGMEWFEVYNNSDRTLDLNGLSVGDDSGIAFTVETTTTLPGRTHFVFAESAAAVPVPAFDWTAAGSSFTLANTADEIILTYGRSELDRVVYEGSWPDSSGVAAQLSSGAIDIDENDLLVNWCAATATYGGVNLGSPGAANRLCR